MPDVTILPLGAEDRAALPDLILPIFAAGETYAVARDMTRQGALDFWCAPEKRVFVAKSGKDILGSYYLRPNQGGGGVHICNCGYITATAAQGRGVARAMLAHSLNEARAQGYLGMQFNHVVSTNTRAVALWQSAGFEIVGRLPRAFRHPTHGLVDAYVMFKWLGGDQA